MQMTNLFIQLTNLFNDVTNPVLKEKIVQKTSESNFLPKCESIAMDNVYTINTSRSTKV